MSDWDSGRLADGQRETRRPSWPDGSTYPYPLPFPLAQALDEDDEMWSADERWSPGQGGYPDVSPPPGGGADGGEEEAAPYPFAYERDDFDATFTQSAVPTEESYYPWPPAPYPAGLKSAPQDRGQPTDSGGERRDGGRRWLVTAGIVAGTAAVGAAAVLLTGGHHGTQRAGGPVTPSAKASLVPPAKGSAAPSAGVGMAVQTPARPSASPGAQAGPPLTMAQARAVLAGYTAANNNANAQRNGTLLATIETGSSYAIDAGLYLTQKAAGAGAYPPFSPVQATYYIPGNEPASGPRWFVVQVANAFTASPQKVASYEYLLFTQSPGGAWQDTIEPYLVSAASAPRIKTGTDGLASAVRPDAASVTVAPGQLPAATAAGQVSLANPGALADRADQQLFQAKVPGGTVTDTHTAAAGPNGQEFALLTADGGALVFYTDAAKVTITPPAGSPLHLTVPGLYSSQQALPQATVAYLEQFAAYDPPAAAGGSPRIIADYSGITGKN